MASKIITLHSFIVKNNRIGVLRKFSQDEVTRAYAHLWKEVFPDNDITGKEFKIDWLIVGNRKRKVRCLFLKNSQGAWYPFTKARLSGKREKPRAKVMRLMREAVEDQVITFKEKFKKKQVSLIESGEVALARERARCPLTGKMMTKVHVDHVVPFIVLADIWLETHTLYDKFEQVKEKDLSSWSDFHKKFSKLALVGASANIDRSSEGYRSIH